MSDRELRRILHDIIDDLDAGRLRAPRPRRFIRWLGAPVLAASLGLGVAGCEDRSIGYTTDAAVEQVDAGTYEDSTAPQVDGGNVFAYGIPPIDEDAGAPSVDADVQQYDGGNMDLYGVPFQGEDAAVDPPPEALYSAPDFEVEPADDAGTPDPDPRP